MHVQAASEEVSRRKEEDVFTLLSVRRPSFCSSAAGWGRWSVSGLWGWTRPLRSPGRPRRDSSHHFQSRHCQITYTGGRRSHTWGSNTWGEDDDRDLNSWRSWNATARWPPACSRTCSRSETLTSSFMEPPDVLTSSHVLCLCGFRLDAAPSSVTPHVKRLLTHCDDVYSRYRLAYQQKLDDVTKTMLQDAKTSNYLNDRLASWSTESLVCQRKLKNLSSVEIKIHSTALSTKSLLVYSKNMKCYKLRINRISSWKLLWKCKLKRLFKRLCIESVLWPSAASHVHCSLVFGLFSFYFLEG